jgi:hypothetical protein
MTLLPSPSWRTLNVENCALNGITYNRRRLIETMLEMNFGQIEGLHIKAGEPVFDPPPKIIREIVFGKENSVSPHLAKTNFVLKRHVIEMFEVMDGIGDGLIYALAVQNGLPVRMKLEKEYRG